MLREHWEGENMYVRVWLDDIGEDNGIEDDTQFLFFIELVPACETCAANLKPVRHYLEFYYLNILYVCSL